MNKPAFLILLLALSVFGFAKQCEAKKKTGKKEVVSVKIHRTVCYGQCPDYMVEINKNGTVTYTSRRFTPDTGIFQKKISKQEAAVVLDLINTYRVDTCREMYENLISDLPGLNFTITYKRRKIQKIFNSAFGPHFLKEIAEAMEAVGKKPDEADGSWKKIGMPEMN